MPSDSAPSWSLRLARAWCVTFGHRFVFPKDVWADLTCARCDWSGPDKPPFEVPHGY